MPITKILEKNASLYGEEVALVEVNPALKKPAKRNWSEFDLVEPLTSESYRREITWGKFNSLSNSFADALLKNGITKGKKVAILLMNCLEWLPIYFGILKTGALAVPMNFRYASDEIKYCLDLSESDCLVFGPEFTERVKELYKDYNTAKKLIFVGDACPEFALSFEKLIEGTNNSDKDIEIDDSDDAAIYFSSGTTGFPKAILHDHKSLMHSCKVEQNHHGQTREDNFLCIPPLYHTGAKMHWFGSLLSGSKAVLLKGVKPEWIINTASEEKASIVWLLVPWAQDILDAVESGEIKLENYDLSKWRLMHIGAQPVPPSLIKRWKKYFPNHQYDTNYGLSESIGPGCVHLGVENIDKVGAIGKAGYGWQVKIVDENGNEAEGENVGELLVKGDGVMKCYYRDEEATKAVLKDGWLYTGDMAMRDKDGFIFLVDRKKDVIISGGENIYPVQIEDFIRLNDAVKDVAVIGMPDHRLGEISAAIIEVKPNCTLTESDVDKFCEALPRYKRPRRIIFDDIPRNPTGKIEKPRLREKYCGVRLVEAQIKS